MKLYYVKEMRGVHAAARFHEKGPYEAVALFSTERDARRFIDAANRSMDAEQEKAARNKLGGASKREGLGC